MRATRHPTSLQIFHTRTAPFPAMDNSCEEIQQALQTLPESLTESWIMHWTVHSVWCGHRAHKPRPHVFLVQNGCTKSFCSCGGPKGRLPCSLLARRLAETKNQLHLHRPHVLDNDSFEERDDRQVARHFHHLCLQQSGHLTDRPGSGAIRTCQ